MTVTHRADRVFFRSLRDREFARLDARGTAYLDFTGAGLYGATQVERHVELLRGAVLGNPHSESLPSRASTAILERARRRVLESLGGDTDEHVVCFTTNATAALRLVGEAFPFVSGSHLVLSADNHNSVLGIREMARAKGARIHVLPLDGELRLDDPGARLPVADPGSPSLLSFPAQSNFSGVRHPLGLVDRAREAGYRVLLDAAAFVPTCRLDLGDVPADFVALSFYKIFGYPTGVGALVARRQALEELRRPGFAGGTVAFASVSQDLHRLLDGPEAFEDGTPPFLGVSALEAGYDFLDTVGLERLDRRVKTLVAGLLQGLSGLRHEAGGPMVRLHGPSDTRDRGGTVAFSVLARDGTAVPFARVVRRADEAGVAVRGGCFCNPGASEAAFGLPGASLAACYEAFRTGPFTPEGLSRCLDGVPVGAVRASVGMATVEEDVRRLLEVVEKAAGAGRGTASKTKRATVSPIAEIAS